MKWRLVLAGLGAGVAIAVVVTSLTAGRADTDTVSVAGPTSTAVTTTTVTTSSSVPVSTAHSTLNQGERDRLAGAVTDAVNDKVSGTTVGLALYDTATGELLASAHGDRQFYAASVVKLLMALDVLHTGGWHAPSETQRARIVEMLSLSHDGDAESYWNSGGRGAIITRMADLMHLPNTRPPRISEQWEMTRTTPNDLVAVYRYLTTQVPPEARQPILDGLAAIRSTASDGFPQHFGIPDGLPGQPRAVKQGWMEISRAVVLNTTGLAGRDYRYIAVLLTELPRGTTFASGRVALTAGISALRPTVAGLP
ncbi:hypothetical protein [Amycolatopsis thermophila]|uniref:Beta-lactamase class A n=1 Tax=Amycolatopsis thermophila TaxID=206084 RepID=A0ABU0EXI5_9PSEU|nr:hypothetical protein [Amycolatopsis thermophila]MDQ0380030.1 hypothetical protein [Amycolatopsis thermophila]